MEEYISKEKDILKEMNEFLELEFQILIFFLIAGGDFYLKTQNRT